MSDKSTLSCTQVAKALSVSPMQVRRWAIRNQVEYSTTPDQLFQFDMIHVRELAQKIKYGDASFRDEVCHIAAIADDSDSQLNLKMMLEDTCQKFDYRLVGVELELQRLLTTYSPDVLFVDVRDGAEMVAICQNIKTNDDTSACICVVFFSVKEHGDYVEHLGDCADYILEKPIASKEIQSIFRLEDCLSVFISLRGDTENIVYQSNKSGTGNNELKKDVNPKTTSAMENLYIPPPPTLFNEITSVLTDHSKIVQLIENDPVVSTKFLQTVNSAVFYSDVKITTVAQAAALLGLDFVRNVVNAVLLRQVSDKLIFPELETYWDIAAETANYATYLSKRLGIGLPDEAYVLGLFHNCGIPIILQKYPNYFDILEQAYSDTSGHIGEVEESLIDCRHDEIGYLVSKVWALPGYIVDTIRHHHDIVFIQNLFDRVENESDRYSQQLADYLVLIKMAEYFSDLSLNLGKQNDNYEWDAIKDSLFKYTEMTEDAFSDLEDEINENFESIDEK